MSGARFRGCTAATSLDGRGCARISRSGASPSIAKAARCADCTFQANPYAETKLVRCNAGAIFDVAVDLRPDSDQFGKWYGIELTAADHRALYIPKGFAHGFQTLTDDADVIYHISEPYRAEAARGVRWDDPAIGIKWPAAETRIISERDRALPLLDAR